MLGAEQTPAIGRRTEREIGSRWPVVACALLFASVSLMSGVTPRDTAVVTALLGANVIGGGYAWSWIVRRQVPVIEAIAMGFAISAAGVVMLKILLPPAVPSLLIWLALPVSTAVVAAVRRSGRHQGRNGGTRVADLVGAAVGVAAAIPLLATRWSAFPIYGIGDFTRSLNDIFFLQTLSRGISSFGPAESGILAGEQIRYHWFTYMWSGSLESASGAGSLVILTRVLPIASAIALALLAVSIAGRLSRSTWLPALAAVTLLLARSVDTFSGQIVVLTSASQTLGAVWLLALTLVVMSIVNEGGTTREFAVLAALSAVVMGSKVSHGFVAIAGLVGAALVWWIVTRERRRPLLLLFSGAIPMAIVFLLWIGGQSSSGTLQWRWNYFTEFSGEPVYSRTVLYGIATSLVVSIGARIPRMAGVPFAAAERPTRNSAVVWFGVFALAAAWAAGILIVSAYGNEQWFLESATVVTAIPSAYGVLLAWRSLRAQRFRTWLGRGSHVLPLLAVIASSVMLGVITQMGLQSATGDERPYLVPTAVIAVAVVLAIAVSVTLVAPSRRGSSTSALAVLAIILVGSSIVFGAIRTVHVWRLPEASQEAAESTAPTDANGVPDDRPTTPPQSVLLSTAATWLDTNSADADIVAIPGRASAFVPALSGLRGYATTEFEAVNLGPRGNAAEFADRAATLADYLGTRSDSARLAMCDDGVRWLWLPSTAVADPASYGDLSYRNDAVAVVRLACP